jgi:cytochrome c biogenesis protein ResB
MLNQIVPSILKSFTTQKSKMFYVGFALGMLYASLWFLVLLQLLAVLLKS